MEPTVHDSTTVEIGGETYDLSEYDFPTRRDSPDPKKMVKAIVECGGVLTDAAAQIGCSEQTLYNWVDRYEPILAAVEVTRSSVAYEAREKLIDLMRNGGDRTAYKAATKLLSVMHPHLDYSRRERREITRKKEEQEVEELKEDLDNMSTDEKLDAFNKIMEKTE